GVRRRQLGRLAEREDRRGRGPRPPRAAELVLSGRRHVRIGAEARLLGLPRILDHELGPGVRHLQAVAPYRAIVRTGPKPNQASRWEPPLLPRGWSASTAAVSMRSRSSASRKRWATRRSAAPRSRSR